VLPTVWAMISGDDMRKIFTAVALIAFAASPVMAKVPAKGHPAVSKLDRVFDYDMIQAQVPYFEHIFGPAWKVDEAVRTYKIDGCQVTLNTAGNDIQSIGLKLSDTCTFDLNKFLRVDSKLPSANKLTFGDLYNVSIGGNAEFYGECMPINCGNAADPYVTAHYDLPHVLQYLEINASVDYTNEAASEPEDKWQAEVGKRVGERNPSDDDYNCGNQTYGVSAERNKFPMQVFKPVKITSIEVGYHLTVPKCEAKGTK